MSIQTHLHQRDNLPVRRKVKEPKSFVLVTGKTINEGLRVCWIVVCHSYNFLAINLIFDINLSNINAHVGKVITIETALDPGF